MQVKQIYELMNQITGEITGKTDLLAEDLGNIVDVGNEILNVTDVENYTKTLIDHIGRVVFVNRKYQGSAPSVLMDAWEYGSVLEKITCEMPAATENETWDLTNGQSYDPNVFYKPTVSAKFFNSKVTFEVPISITDRQVRSAFSNAEQLNGFISMIYNAIENSLTVKIDSLIMRTINNAIGTTFKDEYASALPSSKSGVRAVNLLYLYNQTVTTPITADDAMSDPEFIRFAALQLGLYQDRIATMSTLFNNNGKDRFTTAEDLHIVLLSDFANAANVYLQSNTFHDEYTKLPNAEKVAYWQGTGTDYGFSSVSKINVKTADGDDVVLTGILGVMFDRDAIGVSNLDRRVTTNYNAKAEFTNSWFKFDAGYFNDFNENFVFFFIA